LNPGTLDSSIPAAIAGYQVRPVAFDFGGLQVRLLVIKRLEDYVDTEALLRDPDAPEPPYWAHVWPGGRALAQRMSQVACAGLRVVEIGCGLGLAGIVAALRGAAVTLFDVAPEGVQFTRANADLNGCDVSVVQTDIRCPGIRGLFDYCLAADVTYDPALQRAVAGFVAAHLAPAGRAWCTESVRTFDQGFRCACEAHGLQVSECEVREFDEGREVPVRLTEISLR
jgi:predicted nicotinamide N-methyase